MTEPQLRKHLYDMQYLKENVRDPKMRAHYQDLHDEALLILTAKPIHCSYCGRRSSCEGRICEHPQITEDAESEPYTDGHGSRAPARSF
jgi:hypothetical protein